MDDIIPSDGSPNILSVDTKILRELCLEWIHTKDFMNYFWSMHPTTMTLVPLAVVGLFRKELRGAGTRMGKSSPELMANYRNAVRKAPVVFSQIVMANTAVIYEGISSPALVVVASGPGADEIMVHAAGVLARVHFGDVNTRDEEVLAKSIVDEEYRFGQRRRLPEWLVGSIEAYAADLWVPGEVAHEGGLHSNTLPCFAEPGPEGLTFAIPRTFIEKSIRRTTPPPIVR
ncbi:MAG: hypothetical protein P1U89_10385 [Verrucomicrobiales bacterium]|nr:hypothetical protein [Verrucomicrobiales bacterium]